MITVQIVLRKDRLNTKGEAPLYYRITKNRNPIYVRFNAKLAADFAALQARVLDLEKENVFISSFIG